MLFDIDGEDNQLARTPELGHGDNALCAVHRLPANQILRLSGLPVTLRLPSLWTWQLCPGSFTPRRYQRRMCR